MHGEHGVPASAAGRGPRSAPGRDIGALFRRHGQAFVTAHAPRPRARRALQDISVCRTAVLGGHLDVCRSCGVERPSYNSCRNRHCPKWQALRQARWVEARMQRALPVPHFHVVFTLPAELRPLVAHNRERLFTLLFDTVASTLLDVARDPKRLGALVGITAVLHTWARNLSFHPHLHCIVTAGGLAPDGRAWVPSAERFLLPVKVLSRVFRGRFLAALAQMYERGELAFGGGAAPLGDGAAFARLRDALYRKDWVVYAKAPFANPNALLRYLGQYTHRVAISNHRLLDVGDHEVVFRTRGRQVCRLEPLEFIRRFLQHVLPRGFVKIRHYGLLAAGNINTKLAAARADLEATASTDVATPSAQPGSDPRVDAEPPSWRDLFRELTGSDLGRCPLCAGPLVHVPLPPLPSLGGARAPPSGAS